MTRTAGAWRGRTRTRAGAARLRQQVVDATDAPRRKFVGSFRTRLERRGLGFGLALPSRAVALVTKSPHQSTNQSWLQVQRRLLNHEPTQHRKPKCGEAGPHEERKRRNPRYQGSDCLLNWERVDVYSVRKIGDVVISSNESAGDVRDVERDVRDPNQID